ncbi:MAG: hypothetical protein ACLUOF_11505 [Ruminococcus sp.]
MFVSIKSHDPAVPAAVYAGILVGTVITFSLIPSFRSIINPYYEQRGEVNPELAQVSASEERPCSRTWAAESPLNRRKSRRKAVRRRTHPQGKRKNYFLIYKINTLQSTGKCIITRVVLGIWVAGEKRISAVTEYHLPFSMCMIILNEVKEKYC